ncbi:hypothetical protein FA95DRAFT_1653040 [Auriscalpium vulgare]|uniref:Uncharacterized protein n=1 Tax=Auriscalpium vulgare TaxID=40419 RepID=A0ACB8RXW3_9AGAM|nr:hypothetical protein FA95DRAFT_1653040 [Auriscalpium vulgare]
MTVASLLHRIAVYPTSNLFKSPVLESLYIQGCDGAAVWTNWKTFQGTMLSFKKLRTLELGEMMLLPDISAYDDSKRVVCLPHLELLEVDGSPQQITQLLRHIRIPDTASMNLEVSLRADDIASGHLEEFMAAVAAYFANDRAHDLVESLPPFDALAIFPSPVPAQEAPMSVFVASFEVCESAVRCQIALRSLFTGGPDDIPTFALFEHGLDAVRRLPLFRTVRLIGSNAPPHWPGVVARFNLLLTGRELRLGINVGNDNVFAKCHYDGEKLQIVGNELYRVVY